MNSEVYERWILLIYLHGINYEYNVASLLKIKNTEAPLT